MTKKIIFLGLAYFTLGIFTFTSCVTEYDAYICGITFTGIDSHLDLESETPDTFDERVGFAIYTNSGSPTCYVPNFGIFNTAQATVKCADFKNELVTSSYKLSLDRPIVLDNDTIFAETDLLSIAEISGSTEIDIQKSCDFVRSTIIFNPNLIDQIQFESGEYEVAFECSTDDSRTFVKTRKVIFTD